MEAVVPLSLGALEQNQLLVQGIVFVEVVEARSFILIQQCLVDVPPAEITFEFLEQDSLVCQSLQASY